MERQPTTNTTNGRPLSRLASLIRPDSLPTPQPAQALVPSIPRVQTPPAPLPRNPTLPESPGTNKLPESPGTNTTNGRPLSRLASFIRPDSLPTPQPAQVLVSSIPRVQTPPAPLPRSPTLPESPGTNKLPSFSPEIGQLQPVKVPRAQYPEVPGQNNNGRPPTNNGKGTREDAYREVMIVNLAGVNTGAHMALGRKLYGQKLHQHQMEGEESTEGEGKSAATGKPVQALVNSNVQAVNNSILVSSSCTHRSPGVHVRLLNRPQLKHKGSSKLAASGPDGQPLRSEFV